MLIVALINLDQTPIMLRFEASKNIIRPLPGKVGEIDSVASVRTDLSSDTIDGHKLTEAAVGASRGDLIATNANRSKLIIQNLNATQVIFLGLGENATASKGIAVPGGETLVLPFRGAVEVVASGASTPVRVQEKTLLAPSIRPRSGPPTGVVFTT